MMMKGLLTRLCQKKKEKSEDDMQNPCIVRSEDDFRDDPEAHTMNIVEVPGDFIDNVVVFQNFDSDISEGRRRH